MGTRGRVRHFFFLLAISVVSGSAYARVYLDCLLDLQAVARDRGIPYQRFAPLEDLRPPHHLGNLPERRAQIGQQLSFPIGVFYVGTRLVFRPTGPEAHEVSQIYEGPEGLFLETTSPLGDHVYLRVDSVTHAESRVTVTERPAAMGPTYPIKGHLLSDQRLRQKEMELNQLPALAKRLAQSQMTVNTAVRERPSFPFQVRANVEAANLAMLGLLARGQPVTQEVLESWNVRLNTGLRFTAPMPDAARGITRGTRRAFEENGTLHDIDLTSLHMQARIGGMVTYVYPPATDVVPALRQIVREVNAVDRNTSLENIVGIFQRYYAIHQFPEANKRTARVLLDYMLIKAGFGPLPHDQQTTRRILYISREDLTSLFRAALTSNRRR